MTLHELRGLNTLPAVGALLLFRKPSLKSRKRAESREQRAESRDSQRQEMKIASPNSYSKDRIGGRQDLGAGIGGRISIYGHAGIAANL